jgi:superfamily II DNA or RNA helicase
MSDYENFIASKRLTLPESGFDAGPANPLTFDYQSAVIRWGLRKGRAGIFLDTGMGKTLVQLDMADAVCCREQRPVLLLTPLAVASQTKREAEKFGVRAPVQIVADQSQVSGPGIYLTNYQKLHKFDAAAFVMVALDEGSILKSLDGKTRTQCIEMLSLTPYRFVFTATPSPNDVMEIGNYAEFLGVMSRTEMLAMFFTHDGGDTSKWRLKGHAREKFFEWLASWCVMARNPADLGYDGSRFELPGLVVTEHVIEAGVPAGSLFQSDARTLNDQRAARRETLAERVDRVASLANAHDQPCVVWCELNEESTAATKSINGAVEVTGSMTDEQKESALERFATGEARVIVTKASIAGFGLNWQHCAEQIFIGVTHSFEQYYQCVRRCWRFGQTRPVNVHLVMSDREGAVLKNLQRKQTEHERLVSGVVEAMSYASRNELRQLRGREAYQPATAIQLPAFLQENTHV